MARVETGGMLRVSMETRECFNDLRRRLALAWREMKDPPMELAGDGELSADALIRYLMAQHADHKARCRKAARAAADRRRAGLLDQVVIPAGVVLCEDGIWR